MNPEGLSLLLTPQIIKKMVTALSNMQQWLLAGHPDRRDAGRQDAPFSSTKAAAAAAAG